MIRMIALLLCVSLAVAQERRDAAPTDDRIAATLDKAKSDYEASIARLRKSVLDALAAREDTARSKGDKRSVDGLKAEREAFESTGTLPKLIPVAGYQVGVKNARQALQAAYSEAVKEYTKTRLDEKAAAISEEMRMFAAGKELAPTAGTGDLRRVWVTKAGTERIEWTGGQNWLYTKPATGTRTPLTEVVKTSDYVELRRADGMCFRVHDTIFYWDGGTNGGVRIWKENANPDESHGKWVK